MEERFLLSIKRLNIDINYIQKSLLYLNSEVLARNQIKNINGYDDLRLFIEFSKFTEAQSIYKFFIHQLIIFILIKPTNHSIIKKINFMIWNKYLNKNLSNRIHDLCDYISSNNLNNVNFTRVIELYFELEDYYFENEYRRLELLKY